MTDRWLMCCDALRQIGLAWIERAENAPRGRDMPGELRRQEFLMIGEHVLEIAEALGKMKP